MMAFPLLYSIGVSLTDWSPNSGGMIHFAGLMNYKELFTEPRFYSSLFTMFYFTIFAVVVETFFGVAIAILLNREFIGKTAVKTILLLPMVATPIAIGIAWTLFYQPTIGFANYALSLLGIPPSTWTGSVAGVIPSLVLVDVWEWTPMIILINMAGLAGLPVDPFESARVDGANWWQVVRHLTLPMLAPTIILSVVLRSIDAFKTFDIIYAMTQGGPGYSSETLNIYAFNLSFNYFQFGASSAALMVLLLVVLGSTVVMLKIRKSSQI
jgi:multiple sugar transport system permease protein